MAFKDLREFLTALKRRGELHEIAAPVDKDEEIGVICSENSRVRGPALVFQNINGFRTPLITGVLGTEQRYPKFLEDRKRDFAKSGAKDFSKKGNNVKKD